MAQRYGPAGGRGRSSGISLATMAWASAPGAEPVGPAAVPAPPGAGAVAGAASDARQPIPVSASTPARHAPRKESHWSLPLWTISLARSTSATLQAWARQPRGANGGSPSKISLT